MSKHNDLQATVKVILELHGWTVIENVEGKSKGGKRQEPGISDLTAVKLPKLLWIEIKISPDSLRKSQKIFKAKIEGNKKAGQYIVIQDDYNQIYKYI